MDAKLQLTKQFCELIDEGSQTLATLCRLSEDEKQAIEKLDGEALQQCVKHKQQQLEALAENTLQRNQTLVELGFSADEHGLQQLKSSLPAAIRQTLEKRWLRLSQNLQQAAELNQRNEQIVQRSQHSLGRLLNILQGQTAKTTIYNEAGHKGNYSAQNTLGKA